MVAANWTETADYKDTPQHVQEPGDCVDFCVRRWCVGVCGMVWYGTVVAIVVAAHFIFGVGTKDKRKKRKGAAHPGGRSVGSLTGGGLW